MANLIYHLNFPHSSKLPYIRHQCFYIYIHSLSHRTLPYAGACAYNDEITVWCSFFAQRVSYIIYSKRITPWISYNFFISQDKENATVQALGSGKDSDSTDATKAIVGECIPVGLLVQMAFFGFIFFSFAINVPGRLRWYRLTSTNWKCRRKNEYFLVWIVYAQSAFWFSIMIH